MKSNRFNRFAAIALMAAAIMLPASLVAQQEGKRATAAERGLGLDEKQVEQIAEMRMQHRIGMIDLRAEHQKLRLAMRMELAKSSPDRTELERIVEAAGAVRTKMQKHRIEYLLKVRGVLNDEQWKRFIVHRRGGMDFGPKDRGRRGFRGHRRTMDRRHRGVGPGCRLHQGAGFGAAGSEMGEYGDDGELWMYSLMEEE